MINTDIAILGINPKSICIALLAKYYGLNTVLIDKEPLKDYPLDFALGDYIRREPINFDVLSGIDIPELNQYKLSTFLQTNSEDSHNNCTHKQFNAYLHFLLSQLESSGYVQIIKEGIKSVSNKGPVVLTNNLISSKATVICNEFVYLPKLPIEWCSVPVNGSVLNPYTNSLKDVHNQKVIIWGTDEYQLLSVLYLGAQDNLITWIIDKPYKITTSDVPSEEEWGEKNALGSYYSNELKDIGVRNRYIQSVHNWQPSVYSNHAEKINELVNTGRLLILDRVNTSVSVIKSEVNKGTCFIPVPKRFINIKDIPYITKPASYSIDPLFPLLNNNFMDTNKIYYIGYLSSRLDGLRQLSNIVNGLTGNLILQDIQNNHDR